MKPSLREKGLPLFAPFPTRKPPFPKGIALFPDPGAGETTASASATAPVQLRLGFSFCRSQERRVLAKLIDSQRVFFLCVFFFPSCFGAQFVFVLPKS